MSERLKYAPPIIVNGKLIEQTRGYSGQISCVTGGFLIGRKIETCMGRKTIQISDKDHDQTTSSI